ncbi:ribonuclease P protein component [Corynebacterium heidelbergense]|uniref:Ribonuclease P protein component n=1 Tax=Corynebacterium heidelbergense TaxID=2055947 RepID=A0A364V8C7_9CORY|nr:ribonuclease P protein component [Corynebacterium heidelbergense]RAV32868.1 ribonuclease P protein component [Corynebacterium heidelbergense]
MLSPENRLRASRRFDETTRNGWKKGSRTVVVYVYPGPTGIAGLGVQPIGDRNVRVGLIVSKTVGNAVARHRVSRRIRHIMAIYLKDLGPGAQSEGWIPQGSAVVIRALPAATSASNDKLAADIRNCLSRIERGRRLRRRD